MGRYWAVYFTKPEVTPILQEIHNHASYFKSKIILDRFYFYVFWPKIATNIYKYIQGCLPYTKWARTV